MTNIAQNKGQNSHTISIDNIISDTDPWRIVSRMCKVEARAPVSLFN